MGRSGSIGRRAWMVMFVVVVVGGMLAAAQPAVSTPDRNGKPSLGTWVALPNMSTPRRPLGHWESLPPLPIPLQEFAAVRLSDGRVLVADGSTTGGEVTS